MYITSLIRGVASVINKGAAVQKYIYIIMINDCGVTITKTKILYYDLC